MFHHGATATTPGGTQTTPRRTSEWYRYAQETGLISPHHERVYVPEWELHLLRGAGIGGSPSDASTTACGGGVVERLKVGKRYHGTMGDGENFAPDRDDVGERRVRRALRVVNDGR